MCVCVFALDEVSKVSSVSSLSLIYTWEKISRVFFYRPAARQTLFSRVFQSSREREREREIVAPPPTRASLPLCVSKESTRAASICEFTLRTYTIGLVILPLFSWYDGRGGDDEERDEVRRRRLEFCLESPCWDIPIRMLSEKRDSSSRKSPLLMCSIFEVRVQCGVSERDTSHRSLDRMRDPQGFFRRHRARD